MSLIDSNDLIWMRDMVETTLPDTAIVYSVTKTSDGAGGWTPTLVAQGTVACRLDPITKSLASTMEFGRAESTSVLYQLTLPYDAPMDVDYQVVTGGNTYEVIQLDIDHSWNVSKRVLISEMR